LAIQTTAGNLPQAVTAESLSEQEDWAQDRAMVQAMAKVLDQGTLECH
jgi:hypothetical protein